MSERKPIKRVNRDSASTGEPTIEQPRFYVVTRLDRLYNVYAVPAAPSQHQDRDTSGTIPEPKLPPMLGDLTSLETYPLDAPLIKELLIEGIHLVIEDSSQMAGTNTTTVRTPIRRVTDRKIEQGVQSQGIRRAPRRPIRRLPKNPQQ